MSAPQTLKLPPNLQSWLRASTAEWRVGPLGDRDLAMHIHVSSSSSSSRVDSASQPSTVTPLTRFRWWQSGVGAERSHLMIFAIIDCIGRTNQRTPSKYQPLPAHTTERGLTLSNPATTITVCSETGHAFEHCTRLHYIGRSMYGLTDRQSDTALLHTTLQFEMQPYTIESAQADHRRPIIHHFHFHNSFRQYYRIGTGRKMPVDIDATADLLLLIQQKLRIVRYRYGSLSLFHMLLAQTSRKLQETPCKTLT